MSDIGLVRPRGGRACNARGAYPIRATGFGNFESGRVLPSHIVGSFPMGIIAWLILGLIAGFIASKLYAGTGQGVVVDIILGIVGAFVGGFIVNLFGGIGVTGLNLWSLVVAVIGAVVVLWIYHAMAGRRAL